MTNTAEWTIESNILDPIQDTLDQRVFNGITPRTTVVNFITNLYAKAFERETGLSYHGYVELVMTGSLTTYQWSDTSDCDVSVFPDYHLMYSHGLDALAVKQGLVMMSVDHLDGTFLPGGSHPLQFFVQPPASFPEDMFQPGMRSAYHLDERRWIVEPERDRVHDVAVEFPEIYKRADAMGDKMTTLLDGGEYDLAKELFKQIHVKRQLDQRAGLGDFSEGNIVYKWLVHEGILDRLRNEVGLTISTHHKVAAIPTALSPAETATLKRYAQGKDVLEVGSLLGYSTVAMAETARSVTSVDPHFGYPQNNPKPTLDPFIKNLEDYGVKEKVDVFQGTDAIIGDIGKRFGFAFIDATGMYDDTYRIMEKVLTVLEPGGIIGVHDYMLETWPEATFAVQEFCTNKGFEFQVVDTLALISTTPKVGKVALKDSVMDNLTMKVIYNFEADHITMGTQADVAQMPSSVIVGEYVDGIVTLNPDERHWMNANYFRRLWAYSFPNKPLISVHFRQQDGDVQHIPTKRPTVITKKSDVNYEDAFVYLGNPYNELLNGSSEHFDLLNDFMAERGVGMKEVNGEIVDNTAEFLEKTPMVFGHVGLEDPEEWDPYEWEYENPEPSPENFETHEDYLNANADWAEALYDAEAEFEASQGPRYVYVIYSDFLAGYDYDPQLLSKALGELRQFYPGIVEDDSGERWFTGG